jgi:hypothetical protein
MTIIDDAAAGHRAEANRWDRVEQGDPHRTTHYGAIMEARTLVRSCW